MVQFTSFTGSLPVVQWLSNGRFNGSRASWNSQVFLIIPYIPVLLEEGKSVLVIVTGIIGATG